MHKITDFRTSLFKFHSSEGFYYVDIGLEKADHVVAYIDFEDNDKDKLTDLVTYQITSTSIDFYRYNFNKKDGKFIKSPSFFKLDDTSLLITNVYVGPLVDDSEYGYIITALKDNQYTSYFINREGAQFGKYNFNPTFIGDVNGDRNIEIITYTDSRKIYYIKKTDSQYTITEGDFSNILLNASDINDAGYKYLSYKFAQLGAAMVDVDGDCRNDLLLTSIGEDGNAYLEIYRGRADSSSKQIKYALNENNSTINLGNPNKIGRFNIGNFNGDGFVDIIIPNKELNSNNKPTVKILFNKNVRSYKWSENYCSTHPQYNKEVPIVFDIDEAKEMELDLLDYKFAELKHTPSIVKVVDMKNDVYDGFGAVFQKKDSNEYTICSFINNYKANSNKIFSSYLQFNQKEVNYISFFDLDENGNMDLFVDTQINGTISVFNNIYPDTYFIKAKTLLNDRKYSAETGTNYRYIATDNDGNRNLHFAWQLSMNTDLDMNTPYSLMGIGRSNNYIENLVVISNSYDSATISKASDTYAISPIIPKTQLLITKKRTNEIEWKVDLIVSPTEKLLIMMIIIGAILILILVLIIILHIKETKEDKKQESGTEQFKSWFN